MVLWYTIIIIIIIERALAHGVVGLDPIKQLESVIILKHDVCIVLCTGSRYIHAFQGTCLEFTE